MYCVVLITLCLTLMVAAKINKTLACDRLFYGHKQCCKNRLPRTHGISFDDCYEIANRPNWCDQELCVADKLNFASLDGTIDMSAYMDFIQKGFEDLFDPGEDPVGLIESIDVKCAHGNLTKYGTKEDCDVIKLQQCTKVQYLKKCTDWDNIGYCKGLKDFVPECTKQYE